MVIVGDAAEEFVQTELGQTILGLAKEDAEGAMEAFDKASVTDQDKLIEAKVAYRVAQRFPQYLREIITRGRETLDSMKST